MHQTMHGPRRNVAKSEVRVQVKCVSTKPACGIAALSFVEIGIRRGTEPSKLPERPSFNQSWCAPTIGACPGNTNWRGGLDAADRLIGMSRLMTPAAKRDAVAQFMGPDVERASGAASRWRCSMKMSDNCRSTMPYTLRPQDAAGPSRELTAF